MPVQVSDARSNPNDQIAHAAKVLGRSARRMAVFKAIYHGKKRQNAVDEIAKRTGLSQKKVLTEAKKLVNQHIVSQVGNRGTTAYVKDDFYHQNKPKILRLATDPKKLRKFPTKYNRSSGENYTLVREIRFHRARATAITIDDVTSFSKVRRIKRKQPPTKMAEATFKAGVKQVIDERGKFQDWGGERNDLFTTRLSIAGQTAPCMQEFSWRWIGGLQSCVRPVGAVQMTAGPDGIRGTGPYQSNGLRCP